MRVLFPVPLEKEEDVVLSQQKKEVLQAIISALSTIEEFTPENVQEAVRTALKEKGVGLRDVAHDYRMAITGTDVGPGLFDMMSVIGRDSVESRLKGIL
jgi:glutamyl/glutaminyl-tRNA synthetase